MLLSSKTESSNKVQPVQFSMFARENGGLAEIWRVIKSTQTKEKKVPKLKIDFLSKYMCLFINMYVVCLLYNSVKKERMGKGEKFNYNFQNLNQQLGQNISTHTHAQMKGGEEKRRGPLNSHALTTKIE